MKAHSLTNLESMVGQMQQKHEDDLAEISAKFRKIDAGYRSDTVETQK